MLPNGLINYSALCDSINDVFSDRINPNEVLDKSRSRFNFSEDEARLLYNTVRELREVIKANRILMKTGFQDFDPARTCHITAQQFGRVLKGLSLMPQEEVFELLCKNYFDKNNTREVNYVKFCADVDKPEDMFPSLNFGKKDEGPIVVAGTVPKTKSNFFPGSTKGISVLQNRFQHPTVNLANDPSDVEKRI